MQATVAAATVFLLAMLNLQLQLCILLLHFCTNVAFPDGTTACTQPHLMMSLCPTEPSGKFESKSDMPERSSQIWTAYQIHHILKNALYAL